MKRLCLSMLLFLGCAQQPCSKEPPEMDGLILQPGETVELEVQFYLKDGQVIGGDVIDKKSGKKVGMAKIEEGK